MVHFCLFVLWIFNGYDANPSDTSTVRLYQFHLCHHFRMFNPEDIEYLSTPAATLRRTIRLVQAWGVRLICGAPEVPAVESC
jgi:hypothetical protein